MVNFIVCEFNPFHNGHAYLLKNVHEYPNICIMSSHVTQRGEFSFCDKWNRAQMALEGGADLVLELPAPFAMGQASRFARGAMEIAKGTGLKGRVCFGSEGDVLQQLLTLSRVSEEDLSPIIKAGLKFGLSPAAAMWKAYKQLAPASSEVLSTPNNLLGLEYIKAAPEFEFNAVPRKGVAHDALESSGKFISASALRLTPQRYAEFTPQETHNIYQKIFENGLIPDENKKELLWLHTLRSLSTVEWDELAPDGVGRRMYKAAMKAQSISELLENAKTKCCTHASLRRIALKAFVGKESFMSPTYIRVLGANEVGREILSAMHPTLPVITKPASVKELSDAARAMMDYESRLTDIYSLMLPTPREKGVEFLTGPIMK